MFFLSSVSICSLESCKDKKKNCMKSFVSKLLTGSVIKLLVTSASFPGLIRAAAACGGVIPVRMRAASDCERFTATESDREHLVAPLEQMDI